jgi:signal transduction histidine kinase
VDVARLEAGHMPLAREHVRLGEAVEAAVAQLASQAEAKGIRVEQAIAPRDLTVWADRELLERVIVNLAGNAVKFTPRGGRVAVEGRGDGDGVLLAVRDTGLGIPPEDRACIFDRFTQAGQRRQQGSGLGLAFCKLAVEAHGGRIWVESAVGRGSTFHVRLPAGGGNSPSPPAK